MIVPDKSQPESSDSSESQSETELEGDTKALKTNFYARHILATNRVDTKAHCKKKTGAKFKKQEVSHAQCKKLREKEDHDVSG